jgi:hypothetical protein
MQFRIEWEAIIDGKPVSGIETEASWFLMDQTGGIWSYGPMLSPTLVSDDYTKCIPLIKINDEWLSIEEIEKRLTK